MNLSRLKAWGYDTGVRAVKTFAQSLVAAWGLHQFNVLGVDWRTDLGIAGGAALVSVLQNIQRLPYTTPAEPAVTAPAAAPQAPTDPAATA